MELLQRLHHIFQRFLRVTEHHHRLIEIEQFVVEAGVAGGHGAFVDDVLLDRLAHDRIANNLSGGGLDFSGELAEDECFQFDFLTGVVDVDSD